MIKYTIVEKYPKGMEPGRIYTITYQINSSPKKYSVDMYCMEYQGEKKLVFLSSNPSQCTSKPEYADVFIEEIRKFQKGASYRKHNPIILNEKDQIEKQIKELKEKLNKLEENENKELLKEYNEMSSNKELDEIEKALNTIFKNERYTITETTLNQVFSKAVIYDRVLKIPVKVVQFDFKRYRDLDEYEKIAVMRKYKKNQNKI